MKHLEHYTREMKQVADQASKSKGIIGGGGFAWLMMIIGVIVTGTMTYALTHKGMSSSALWSEWVDIAAFFPVGLLEGSALALVYGRHHWFRSREQRALADVASWSIWIVLAATSICHFAAGDSQDSTLNWLMSIYASYILPLTIVAVPMLWKRLYDAAPESAMRVAVLEAEAKLRSDLVDVAREQNGLMIDAYREALATPKVNQARRELFERASIQHAQEITGFIDAEIADDDLAEVHPKKTQVWRGSQLLNGEEKRPN